MRFNPNATFDCLFIAQRLQSQSVAFTGPALHLFAYLACLLSLYRRNIVSDWGYTFVGTELGAPYSLEIDSAMKDLHGCGFFLQAGGRLSMTTAAELTLNEFAGLEINQDRAQCLEAACSCVSAFSIGMVTSAMSKEPELERSKLVPSSRMLLEDAALSQLYTQFEALRVNLGEQIADLRLPAVVWLSALYRLNSDSDYDA
jgi:hypothetical protein